MFRVQLLGHALNFFDQRRARFPVFRELAGGQEQAGGTIAQQIVIIHFLALQVRHGDRVRPRRCRFATLEQLAGIAALVVGALEELAEPAGAQLHLVSALLTFQDRAIVTLDPEFALLDHIAIAIRVVTADVQLALFVNQVIFHGGATLLAPFFAAQFVGFRFFIVIRFHRFGFFTGQQIHGGGAALFRR